MSYFRCVQCTLHNEEIIKMSMGQLLQLGPSGPKPLISGYSSYLRYQIFNYWDEAGYTISVASGGKRKNGDEKKGQKGRKKGKERKGINRDDTDICPTPGLTMLARRLRCCAPDIMDQLVNNLVYNYSTSCIR